MHIRTTSISCSLERLCNIRPPQSILLDSICRKEFAIKNMCILLLFISDMLYLIYMVKVTVHIYVPGTDYIILVQVQNKNVQPLV